MKKTGKWKALLGQRKWNTAMVIIAINGKATSLKDQRTKLEIRLGRIKKVLYQKNLSYILEIIKTKIINIYYNNLLVEYFDIEKTWELVAHKYYWLILKVDVEYYVKEYNVYLAWKSVT